MTRQAQRTPLFGALSISDSQLSTRRTLLGTRSSAASMNAKSRRWIIPSERTIFTSFMDRQASGSYSFLFGLLTFAQHDAKGRCVCGSILKFTVI